MNGRRDLQQPTACHKKAEPEDQQTDSKLHNTGQNAAETERSDRINRLSQTTATGHSAGMFSDTFTAEKVAALGTAGHCLAVCMVKTALNLQTAHGAGDGAGVGGVPVR